MIILCLVDKKSQNIKLINEYQELGVEIFN